MFDWVLNTPYPLAGIGRKPQSLKKNSKIVILFRRVFRTQSNIYDGTFLEK